MIDQSDLETQLRAAFGRPRTAISADEVFARTAVHAGSTGVTTVSRRPRRPLPPGLRWVWLGVVAALVVVLVFGFRWAFPPKPSGVSPARPSLVRVDLSATPLGWVPYALGDAQIRSHRVGF
jgi:hypothetical protein